MHDCPAFGCPCYPGYLAHVLWNVDRHLKITTTGYSTKQAKPKITDNDCFFYPYICHLVGRVLLPEAPRLVAQVTLFETELVPPLVSPAGSPWNVSQWQSWHVPLWTRTLAATGKQSPHTRHLSAHLRSCLFLFFLFL